jgi:putative ABC transport system permease protein
MLKNYIRTAWRILGKKKSFSVMNIVGLAIGLTCFILISLYIKDELSFDRFHSKSDRIYRIHTDILFGGTSFKLAQSPDPMGANLKRDYPQVEQYARLFLNGGKNIKKGNEFIYEQAVAYADSTLFDVFSFPALYGNTRTALAEPNTAVLTEEAAKKYFDTPDAVGQTLELDRETYKITAVIKDMPSNSHFNFDFLLSMDNVRYNWNNYLSNNFYTYLLLKPGVNYRTFEKKFDEVLDKYVLPQAKQYMEIKSMDEFRKAGNKLEYSLIPLTEIHLHSDKTNELAPTGDMRYVYIFSAVAIFILLIACVNFMNLSTARSSNRAKEVGIRKVLGSERKKIVAQFLVESIVISFIAMLFSLVLVTLLLPYYNDLTGKQFTVSLLFQYKWLVFFAALPLVVGILAGIYPAFFLSAFKPIAVLKGKMSAGPGKSMVRNVLVVFQFTTCIVLIVSTLVVYGQLNFIRNKKLGFNKEQVLIVNGTGALGKKAGAFRDEVLQLQGVLDGTLSGYLPVRSSRTDYSFSTESVMNSDNGFNMQVWQVDERYVSTMGMELIKGRNFRPGSKEDSTSLIINETSAARLGYADPIGKIIYSKDFSSENVAAPFKIIGVVKNFHFESLKENIGPLSLALEPSPYLASFRINTADMPGLLKQIESKWKTMVTGRAFSYQFLDESFNDMYRAEQRVGKIAVTFSILAVLIACLGLFGLVAYMAEQRTKEIGIRKVLGASVPGIVRLISADFIKLVIISFVIATPLAWWAMHQWLQNFAYRMDIGWIVFVLAGIGALLIAGITLSFQAIKAAIANPVKSLRTE